MAMNHQGFWLNKITGASSRAILPKKAKELIVKQICLNCGAIIKEEWRNCHKQCPYFPFFSSLLKLDSNVAFLPRYDNQPNR